jgi:cytochrome c oxidase assembly protein subunit 15
MYITFIMDQNKNIYISYWLLIITVLVSLMIIIGGLTRLTDSGLSITRWDLFTGILPPLSLEDWNHKFLLYKQIPEFKLLNSSMSLDGFKVIYWWEYVHRLLGRVIGIFYLFPLIFFTTYFKLELRVKFFLFLIFFLICFQGFIGWYMVESGLTERTDVSHFRLSLHLSIAFIILIFLIINFLKFKYPNSKKQKNRLPFNLPIAFLFLVFLQISLGALVSGLDAGQIYQTWPFMGDSYFPNDSNIEDMKNLELFYNPSLLQFLHRNFAYLIIGFFLLIFFIIIKNKIFVHLKMAIFFVFLALVFQIILGILTILSGAQIFLASMHQTGSIILIISSLFLIHKDSKIN